MSDRAPWFKCYPSKLLGALGGMTPDAGYTYTVVLLRIYEADGPVLETARSLARRSGLSERRVADALVELVEAGKLSWCDDGRLDSSTTHDELASRSDRREARSGAGKASAEKRSEVNGKTTEKNRGAKDQQNQRTAATPVQQDANDIELEEEVERTSETSSLRSAQTSLIDGAVEALQPSHRKRGCRLPPDWWPDESLKAYARQELSDDNACRRETERFKNHWAAASGSGATKLDWGAAYRNWIMKAADSQPRAGPTGSRDAPPRLRGSDRLLSTMNGMFDDDQPATSAQPTLRLGAHSTADEA